MKCRVVLLAAGEGKRMRSSIPKVLHPLLSKPMILYVLEAVKALSPERTIVVVGRGAEEVKEALKGEELVFVLQQQQLGTGHAVMQARAHLDGFSGTTLVLYGDTPLLRAETLKELLELHHRKGATLTLMTALLPDPSGYGRILRDAQGELVEIVEDREAKERGLQDVKEVNGGVYAFKTPFLLSALEELRPSKAKGEYYLTDLVAVARRRGEKVLGFRAPDPAEILGVNTRAELAAAQRALASRIAERWMSEGVTIEAPETVIIEPGVQIGQDTVIRPFCYLRGSTTVGRRCTIGPHVEIVDSRLADEVTVRFACYITESVLERGTTVGPFSHLRPGAYLEEGAKVGNFVEVKKSRLGRGTKANHLAYIGDALVGEGVNIGAGTITCNYDGFRKHPTVIGDRAFIGSNVALVAPVKVGEGALVGAGSVITKDVPPGALGVGRARQRNLKRWVAKWMRRKREG